jgi:hypothetical protein
MLHIIKKKKLETSKFILLIWIPATAPTQGYSDYDVLSESDRGAWVGGCKK